jgi:beta-galactosidase
VEAVRRRSPDSSWLFLANDTEESHEVDIAGHDLVTARDVDRLHLAPGEVAVVRER